MAWVGLALTVFSTAMDISAQKKEEKAIKAANIETANILDQRAEQSIAAGQRGMLEERRKKELVVSRAIAVGAASGAGGPDIINIIADIEGEGVYRESIAMYQAEQEARDLKLKASNLRRGVRTLESAGKTARTATALRGAASAYDAYSRAYPSGGSDGFQTHGNIDSSYR